MSRRKSGVYLNTVSKQFIFSYYNNIVVYPAIPSRILIM